MQINTKSHNFAIRQIIIYPEGGYTKEAKRNKVKLIKYFLNQHYISKEEANYYSNELKNINKRGERYESNDYEGQEACERLEEEAQLRSENQEPEPEKEDGDLPF